MRMHRSDIEARAEGGDVGPGLQQALDAFKTIPLDESCGVGYNAVSPERKAGQWLQRLNI